jgi:hypothetical protein
MLSFLANFSALQGLGLFIHVSCTILTMLLDQANINHHTNFVIKNSGKNPSNRS